MSDTVIFAFGAAVFTIAFTGAWLFLYARYFRPSYMRQNAGREVRAGSERAAAVPASGIATRPRS